MAWFDTAWSYRKQIVIDADQVSATLSNFTVLVSVTDTDLRDNAQADGDDILFTSDDEVTQLSHEIESYDNSTGTLVAHVKVPSLSGSVDTTIYIYFGNAAAANQEDITNTWDANYVAVYHLTQDPSGTAPQILDSTSNNIDGTSSGTMTSDDVVAAQINDGIDFDGTDDFIDLDTQLRSTFNGAATITLSAWIKADTFPSSGMRVLQQEITNLGDGIQFAIRVVDAGGELTTRANDGTNAEESSAGVISVDTWYYVVSVYDGSDSLKIYLDGSLVDTQSATLPSDLGTSEANAVCHIGAVSIGGGARFWDGLLDEIRLSDSVRNAAWIATEYSNQNAPGTFYTVGALETVSFTYQFMNLDMSNIGFRRSWSN